MNTSAPAGLVSDNSGNAYSDLPPSNEKGKGKKKCYDLKIESVTWSSTRPVLKALRVKRYKMLFTVKVKNTGKGKSLKCDVMLFIGKHL